MFRRASGRPRPLPREFLDWQVALRRHTMEERHGAPHAGVAPLVTVHRPGPGPGFLSSSVICGLLPHPEQLARKTEEFRSLYESGLEAGARAVYDRGIQYFRDYYRSADDFDPDSLTTLLPEKTPLAEALRADPRCALVFFVFDLTDRSEIGRLRCLQLDGFAELLDAGPVYDNVLWHNALFHGVVDDHVVIRFRHEASFDTRFGAMEPIVS
ncbi:hypothetical protein KJ059_09040 [Myxococcota bacterium]|nr:hypothetical protein [Myxococcota bacterium]MCZ7620784.1 hypothetical protein [Myxococcota bacterium]